MVLHAPLTGLVEIIANCLQRTACTLGLAGGADLAAMPDQVEMEGVEGAGGQERFPGGFDLLRRGATRRQAQALADALNMGINREGAQVKTEEQDNAGGFVTNAWEAGQVGQRGWRWQGCQVRKRISAVIPFELCQRGDKVGRLLMIHPCRTNRQLDLAKRG